MSSQRSVRRSHTANTKPTPSARTVGTAVLFVLIMGGGLALFYGSRTPEYTTEALLLFSRYDPSQALTGRANIAPAVDMLEPVINDAVAEEAATTVHITSDVLRRRTTATPSNTGATLTLTGTANTPEEAHALVRAVGDAYIHTETQAAAASLRRSADSLAGPIADLEVTIAATPEGIPGELGVRSAQVTQLAELQGTRTRLLAAAAEYPGQIRYLVRPVLPQSPSSFTPVDGATQGAILGLLAAGLLAFLKRQRLGSETSRSDEGGEPVLVTPPAERDAELSSRATSETIR